MISGGSQMNEESRTLNPADAFCNCGSALVECMLMVGNGVGVVMVWIGEWCAVVSHFMSSSNAFTTCGAHASEPFRADGNWLQIPHFPPGFDSEPDWVTSHVGFSRESPPRDPSILPVSPPASEGIPFIMPPRKAGSAAAKPAAVLLSPDFCADDADVVIRAAGVLDFRVHKLILSLASPVFKDMFTIPQPLTDALDALPHVDVDESAETWEFILRTVYPMPHPIIDDLDDLEPLLLAAKKYEMQPLIDIHKKGLENLAFVQEDPLRLYAIACACGLEDQAKFVARNSELLTVTRRFNIGDPKGVSLGSYHNLVSFLAERDNEWYQTLARAPISLDADGCRCRAQLKEELYSKIRENLKRPYLQTEQVYLKALEDRSRYGPLVCNGAERCSTVDSGMRGFIERMVADRESLCDRFMREKRYVQRRPSALPPELP